MAGAIERSPSGRARGGREDGHRGGYRRTFGFPVASAAGASGPGAGVDVGSIEAKTTAAAVDAAVAAGTLPRVELTYARAVDDDSASGRIRAEALLPRPEDPTRIDRVPLPLDMAAVDIREVLADGVRAAAKVHLEGTLAEMTEACAAVGLRLELRDGVVARDTASRPGGEAGAELSTTAVTTDDRGTDDVDEDEDGWGAAPRPAIVVRLTPLGTSVQLTRERRGGELTLVGACRLASSSAAESLRKSLSRGGAAGESLPVALAALARAALEHDIRAAIRARGMFPHPAPRAFRCPRGWPSVTRRPAAAVSPPPGRGHRRIRRRLGDATYAGAPAERTSTASIFVLHTRRGNPAVTPEVTVWGPAFGLGVSAGTKRRRSAGASGDSVEFTAEAVADAMAAAARAETVSAQRLAVTSWLASRGIKFDDVRAVGKAKETGKVPAATVSFSARLGDEAGEALVAGVRMEFCGDDGIVAVVRSPWRANASGDPAVFAATAAAASCGGRRRRRRIRGRDASSRSRTRTDDPRPGRRARMCIAPSRTSRSRADSKRRRGHGGGGGDGTSVGGRGGEEWRYGAGRLGRGRERGGGDGCRADADARRGGKNVGRRRGGEGVRGGEGRGFRSLLRRARRVMR